MGLFQNNNNNPMVLQNMLKAGRNQVQKDIIDYFFAGSGCLAKKSKINDGSYMSLIKARLDSIDVNARALEKLGVDEDQVKEIEAISFASYYFDENSLVKVGKDQKTRSSDYQVTRLFFSSEQLFIYQLNFSMIDNTVVELTKEFFYEDIVSYAEVEKIDEKLVNDKGGCLGGSKQHYDLVKKSSFQIVVPGDIFSFSISSSEKVTASLVGLKSRLREKKGE